MVKILSISLIRNWSQQDLHNPEIVHGVLQICYTDKNKFKLRKVPVTETRKTILETWKDQTKTSWRILPSGVYLNEGIIPNNVKMKPPRS